MKLSLIALLLISSMTNQRAASDVPDAHLDQEFKIRIGQESLVDKVRIKFAAVTKDNRCPCEHECASFHNAVVLLRLGTPAREDKYVVFNTNSKSQEIAARGYKISLINLDPCPEENGNIDRAEYVATLLVTKSQSANGSFDQGSSSAGIRGEHRPNFSGTWSFAGVDAGTSIRIVHRGKELDISFEGFAMGSVSVTRNVYYIDGQPHTTTQTEYRKRRSTNKTENYKTTEVRSLVRWDGDKLVFVVEGEESKWELSESGQELILNEGKAVYKRIS